MAPRQPAKGSRAPRVTRHLHEWYRRTDTAFLRLRRRIKLSLGVLDPLRLDVYGGYAGPGRGVVWGRALENEVPAEPSPDDRWFDNLKRSLRQLESDEVPFLSVAVELGESRLDVETDDEGYFCAELSLPAPLEPGWRSARAEVTDETYELSRGVSGVGRVLVPSRHARFGVVSDIDDTILQSHVETRLKQAYLTLFGNAITRLSYEGTSELYRGLQAAGRDAPFFYVSRSAWNIHAMFEYFVDHQNLPRGPFVLRDVDIFKHPEQRRGHKRREIDRIFDTHPDLPFVLIGDSGQADAAVYADVAAAHPGRVRAILIRSVSSKSRARQVRELLSSRCPDLPTLVFEEAAEATRRCEELGLWRDPTAATENPANDSPRAAAGDPGG